MTFHFFRDLEAKLVHLELRVKGEKEVKVEAKVLRVIVVFSVFKVFPVLWYVNISYWTTLPITGARL